MPSTGAWIGIGLGILVLIIFVVGIIALIVWLASSSDSGPTGQTGGTGSTGCTGSACTTVPPGGTVPPPPDPMACPGPTGFCGVTAGGIYCSLPDDTCYTIVIPPGCTTWLNYNPSPPAGSLDFQTFLLQASTSNGKPALLTADDYNSKAYLTLPVSLQPYVKILSALQEQGLVYGQVIRLRSENGVWYYRVSGPITDQGGSNSKDQPLMIAYNYGTCVSAYNNPCIFTYPDTVCNKTQVGGNNLLQAFYVRTALAEFGLLVCNNPCTENGVLGCQTANGCLGPTGISLSPSVGVNCTLPQIYWDRTVQPSTEYQNKILPNITQTQYQNGTNLPPVLDSLRRTGMEWGTVSAFITKWGMWLTPALNIAPAMFQPLFVAYNYAQPGISCTTSQCVNCYSSTPGTAGSNDQQAIAVYKAWAAFNPKLRTITQPPSWLPVNQWLGPF